MKQSPAAPRAEELEQARLWADAVFSEPPFSFSLGTVSSAEVFARADGAERVINDTAQVRTSEAVWLDAETGLEVRCDMTLYKDFPVVEWMLHFRNTGDVDTPVISDIRTLDALFAGNGDNDPLLHHNTGSPYSAEDYKPFKTTLTQGMEKRVATCGGRSSDCNLPYLGLEWPGDEPSGVLMAIGWPGQWAVDFNREEDTSVRISAGQELTHFLLHPGEEVRAPRIVLSFWQGAGENGVSGKARAQNVWRRWMQRYNTPGLDGKPPVPQLAACSSHQYGEMIHANEENQKMFVNRYHKENLGLDYWWMDAGWYPNEWGWPHTGTWEIDTKRFPDGFRPITDRAHEKGFRTIVWFEPERVTKDTWLWNEHPEWLLEAEGIEQKLLDLGNQEALHWLIEHVDAFLTREGVDLYRQDFNMEPLPYWREKDAEDRQGIAEIGHVTGLLTFWDELQRRRPGLIIDTCASGGRRNDVDALKRAVPLLRSDWIFEPSSQQSHTYGISSWIPYYGAGVNGLDEYCLRSTFCPAQIACWDLRRDDLPYDLLREMTTEWRSAAAAMLGDYYPLTEYHLENDVWMAWQFDLPEENRGIVQVFRRPESPYEQARFRLVALEPEARYCVEGLPGGESLEATGESLMSEGLLVRFTQKPDSATIRYSVI